MSKHAAEEQGLDDHGDEAARRWRQEHDGIESARSARSIRKSSRTGRTGCSCSAAATSSLSGAASPLFRWPRIAVGRGTERAPRRSW